MTQVRETTGRFSVQNLSDRFWAKVIKTDSCWIWMGKSDPKGYGRIRVEKRFSMAHHISYLLKFGEWIPFGYEPDHTCKNPSCVRWAYGHLESIPRGEHIKRTALTHRNRVKTECDYGHSDWRFRKNGSRYCGECNRLRGLRK